MRSQHIRPFGLLVGLVTMLGMASIAAGEALTEQQIGRQIERRLSEAAFSNVNVSVQASVVRLSGTVPSLWAKAAAIAKVRDLSDVTSVVSALEVERAESDRAIAEQIAKQIRRVSIPGPVSAVRPGVSAQPGVASARFHSSMNQHEAGFGFDDREAGFGYNDRGTGFELDDSRFGFWSDFGLDHHEDDTGDTEFHRVYRGDHRRPGFGADDKFRADIEEALYGHTRTFFYGIFDYVSGGIDDGVVTLTGYVTDQYKAGEMAELVSRVQGVKEIQNQIEVLPVSSFDDQLRASIARRLYGDVLMPHVTIAAPLHIIVDNLHVTLAGTVFSEVEKRRAGHIARLTFGVLSVQNNLKIELT